MRSASGRAGSTARSAARPRHRRSPRARARPRRACRRAGPRTPAAGAGRPSTTRAWRGAGRAPPRSRAPGSPSRSMRSTVELVNVSNTSWLAKPSSSSARGRSCSMNEPVAAKFLRSMICDSSSARYAGSACDRRMRSTSNPCVLESSAAPSTGSLARCSTARCASSHAGGSMMCESASCIGRVAYATSRTIRRPVHGRRCSQGCSSMTLRAPILRSPRPYLTCPEVAHGTAGDRPP